MPPRSKVLTTLPPNIRDEVERRILAKGFSNYQALADWVREKGYDISQVSLWRYGNSIKTQVAATRFAMRQARLLSREGTSHQAQFSEALVQVVQQRLLSMLEQVEQADDLTQLVRHTAELARVCFAHQQWMVENKRKEELHRRQVEREDEQREEEYQARSMPLLLKQYQSRRHQSADSGNPEPEPASSGSNAAEINRDTQGAKP